MSLLPEEQTEIEQAIGKALRDVSRPNPYRLKAALRILMTTNLETFETVCSAAVQKELDEFIKLVRAPELIAPDSCRDETSRLAVINYIKQYTLSNFHLLDNRVSILPNTYMIKKSIVEGERLKSVVHASALRNVVANAHHFDKLQDKLKAEGIARDKINEQVRLAVQYTKELYKAVSEGNISHLLQCLSHHGVDVNLPDEQGMTPLHIAAREGLTETVKLLLTVPDIQPNLASNNGWTPLHIAARLGHADIVDALLTMPNINVNSVNSDGWSALHWAAWHGFTETVTVLLTAPGVKINLADQNRTTPFHLAARNGHPDVIAVLLSFEQIDVNALDNEQMTPLHLATMYNHAAAVTVLLSSPNIEVNRKDVDGLTPLHWAARNGYTNILKALLSHRDILVDGLDNSGLTPMDWALRNGHFVIEQYLAPLSTRKPPKKHWTQKLKHFFIRKRP